jgi:protein phosphatase
VIIRSAVSTHTGRRRRHNEDAFVREPPLFAVADGMGGARAGEVASGLAAAALRAGSDNGGSGKERVVALIQQANRNVYERSNQDADVAGMGTTMTVALVEGSEVIFGHVGDSRAYIFRDDALEQLTDDHSLVAELVRGGKLSPEEAEHHPQRSVITRAIGTDPDVDVDTFVVDARPGDVFLLCSDGLTDMIGDSEIVDAMTRSANLDEATRELVRLANRAGGEDNITVVAFELADEPAEEILEQTMEQTVEQTREQTVPANANEPGAPAEQPARSTRRFLPLLALLGVFVVIAVVLWVLTNR